MCNPKPSFRFEINSLPVNDASISSPIFISGGCLWYIRVHPKVNDHGHDHLSLFLSVANRNTLRTGWKRSVNFNFVILNQSEKELYRSSSSSSDTNTLFRAESPSWGFSKVLPHSKIHEEGDKLIIEVYIEVVEAFDGEVGDESEKNKKTVDINGFQVLDSQVTSVKKIFEEHPDIAEDFKPKNQVVKTAYMNALLKLIEKLQKPSKSFSENKLSRACNKLNELMDVGFKLDWLKLKLEDISLEKQKSDVDESRVLELERRVKNLELDKVLLEKKIADKANIDCLKKKSDDAEKFRVRQLEIRLKGIELLDLGFELNSLKRKLDQVTLDRKKSTEADETRAQELEQRVKDLELMELGFKVDSLKTKLDEACLEKKKSDDADEARAQELEKRVKDLELIELGFNHVLNDKLDQAFLEMDKSDGVDEARVEQLEERVKDLEVMELGFKLNSLETKLDEVRKKSDDADEARAKQYEKRVKDLELMELGFTDVLNERLDQVFLEMEKFDEARAEQLEEERVKNIELMEMRCKLDSLMTELGKAYLERKKSDEVDEARAQQLEKRIKDLELMDSGYNLECLKAKLDEASMERKKSYDADEARAKQLEKRVKDLEVMEFGSKLKSLNTKLVQVSLEMMKADDAADEARAQQLEEERVKNIEMMEMRSKLDSLKTDLVEVSLEKKESDDANVFRVQELELRVLKDIEVMDLRIKMLEDVSIERNISDNIDRSRVEQLEESVEFLLRMVSDLRGELKKKKDKSLDADGFLLVDEVE